MIAATPERLQHAVSALYPDIERRVARNHRPRSERELWRELSSCLLSSQVPYELADAAAEAIDAEGLLLERLVNPASLEMVLSRPLPVAGGARRYRFPVKRAGQLAATHGAIMAQADGLFDLLGGFVTAEAARGWFVAHAPGLGPKQASMFLRNTGFSYELAVLDRHVLTYMHALGLSVTGSQALGSLPRYHHCEALLVDHASELGYRVGLLDWAIWIVVRAARGMQVEGATT